MFQADKGDNWIQ